MSLPQRALIAIAAVLAVAGPVLLMKFDIGRNANTPAAAIIERPAAR
jgi:hypothetical protein